MLGVREILNYLFNGLRAVPILGGLIKRISDAVRAVFSQSFSNPPRPSTLPPLRTRDVSIIVGTPSFSTSPVPFAPTLVVSSAVDRPFPCIPESFVRRATLDPRDVLGGGGASVSLERSAESGSPIPLSYCESSPAERQAARVRVYADLFHLAPTEPRQIPLMTSYHGEKCYLFKRGEDLWFGMSHFSSKFLVLKQDGTTECFQWVWPNSGKPLCVKICNENEVHLEASRNFRLELNTRCFDASDQEWNFRWDFLSADRPEWNEKYASPYFATSMASMELLLANRDHILDFLRTGDIHSPIISGFLDAFSSFRTAGTIDQLRVSHPAIAGAESIPSGGGRSGAVSGPPLLPVVVGGGGAAASRAERAGSLTLPLGAVPPSEGIEESVVLGPVWNRVCESDDSFFTFSLTRRPDGSLEVSSTKRFGGRGFGDCGGRNLSIVITPERSLQLSITKTSSNRMTGGFGSKVHYRLTRDGSGFSIQSSEREIASDYGPPTKIANSPQDFSSDVEFFLNSMRTIQRLWSSPYSLVIPEGAAPVAYSLRDLSHQIPPARLEALAPLSQGTGGITGRNSYLQTRFYCRCPSSLVPTLC